jgi:signal transduction protein with GAF and PtsI domain
MNSIKLNILLFFGFLFFLGVGLAETSEFRYDSHGKRDPFVSAGQLEVSTNQLRYSDLKLEGIIVDRGSSHAMINSEIVQIGDVLEGFNVDGIEANKVVLKKDGELYELYLRQEEELLKQLVQMEQLANIPKELDSVSNRSRLEEETEGDAANLVMEEELKKFQDVTNNREEALSGSLLGDMEDLGDL